MNARDLMWEWLAYGKSAASLPKDSPLEAFFADKVVPLLATPLHEKALAACKAHGARNPGADSCLTPTSEACAQVGREALAAEKPKERYRMGPVPLTNPEIYVRPWYVIDGDANQWIGTFSHESDARAYAAQKNAEGK